MTVVKVKDGQLVFIIQDFKIYEGNIVEFINKREVMVSAEVNHFMPIKRQYGVNFFMTREKAEKVLAIKLEEEKQRKIEEKIKWEQEKLKREKQIGETFREAKKTICNACGLPIGTFGHCGCSY